MINQSNKGKRIQLVRTSDPYTRLRPGAMGTIVHERVDGIGGHTVSVNWDDGSTLALILGEDSWKVID